MTAFSTPIEVLSFLAPNVPVAALLVRLPFIPCSAAPAAGAGEG